MANLTITIALEYARRGIHINGNADFRQPWSSE
jgi:hypothetical protein